MIERGEHFRFTLKSRQSLLVLRDRAWQNLYRYFAFELYLIWWRQSLLSLRQQLSQSSLRIVSVGGIT